MELKRINQIDIEIRAGETVYISGVMDRQGLAKLRAKLAVIEALLDDEAAAPANRYIVAPEFPGPPAFHEHVPGTEDETVDYNRLTAALFSLHREECLSIGERLSRPLSQPLSEPLGAESP